MKHNPDWSKEENILLLDFYMSFQGITLPITKDSRIIMLSEDIKLIAKSSGAVPSNKDFRSPDSISRQMNKLIYHDPKRKKKEPNDVSNLMKEVWNEFYENSKALKKKSGEIRKKYGLKSRPNWVYEERILLMEFYMSLKRKPVPVYTDDRITKIANEIRKFAISLGFRGDGRFRSNASIHTQTRKIAFYDKNNKNKNDKYVNSVKLTEKIWNRFKDNSDGLKKEADRIRKRMSVPKISLTEDSNIDFKKYINQLTEEEFDSIIIKTKPKSHSSSKRKKSKSSRSKKINYVEKTEQDIKIGADGEEFVLNHEKRRLSQMGIKNLERKVICVSNNEKLGYDILSCVDSSHKKLLIEVKTTKGKKQKPFYITRNQYETSKDCINQYCVYRVIDIYGNPKIEIFESPLEKLLVLEPTQYQAKIR